MSDLILASLHHLLVFGLVALMMAARVLLHDPDVDPIRLARLDGGAGALSALVMAVGVSRVIWGGKGWAFYETNPFFWAKIGCFILIGVLTVPGTMAFLRWRRTRLDDPAFQPATAEVARIRRLSGIQAIVLAVLLVCAAAMARWPF